MRAAWTINTIPASQQPQQQQQQQQPQQQQPSSLQHYFTSNQKMPPSTLAMAPKVPDEYAANEFSVKRIFWPQNTSTSYFSSKVNANNEPVQPSHHSLQIVSKIFSHTISK